MVRPANRNRVSFLPDGADAWVTTGVTLLSAATSARVAIDAPCGDRGVCGKCRVQAEGALEPPTRAERVLIDAEELHEGWRLACQARVAGDVTVRVPERALKPAVVPVSDVPLRPNVRKLLLHIPGPTVEDPSSDLDRLRSEMSRDAPGLRVSLQVARMLPELLGNRPREVTAVVAGDALLTIEPGDTASACYGLAVDLGTTSVVVMLVDLTDGRILGVESRLNGQANHGADVVSRVAFSTMQPEGLATLQAAAVDTINSATQALVRAAGVDARHIYEVVVVGNTCMNHLLLGIDPASLARAPYQAVVTEAVSHPAGELGLAINPSGLVYTLPNIAGFVGSDTVAVILATAMHQSEDIQLALDLGTNGEMVLGNRGRLVACSAAAGPAFEGARISCGMRATGGAIERVWIDGDDVGLQVIGGGAPKGICGSGLLDAVAQLLSAGLLDDSGRLARQDGTGSPVAPGLAERLVRDGGTRGFALFKRGRRPVVLTQADVRELQLAKGAIRAGIAILMERLGIDERAIAQVLLAGAFGSYIGPASARSIGLVPAVPLERVTAVGNAAGQGALMALLSTDFREEATKIARSVEYVELSAHPGFMSLFMQAMTLSPLAIASCE